MTSRRRAARRDFNIRVRICRAQTARFAILSEACMRILFLISVVAFAALVWASISIAQHIRRARRRRKLVLDAASPAQAVTAFSSDAAVAVVAPMETAASEAPSARNSAADRSAPAPPAPVRFPLSSQRASASSDADRAGDAQYSDGPASGRGPAAPPRPMRPEWAYYNKEMGDLSDPLPGGRYRGRGRNS
jgi:hypothetical protein